VTLVRLAAALLFTNTAAPAPRPPPPLAPPAPPLATALLIVRLEIAAVPDCTKKARPALLASSVLPLPVTVTLLVIIGSDCVSVMLAVTLMLLSPPPLAAKIALRRAVSFATSTAQADQLPSGDRQVPSSRPAVSARRCVRSHVRAGAGEITLSQTEVSGAHRLCGAPRHATACVRRERMTSSPRARPPGSTGGVRPLLPTFQTDVWVPPYVILRAQRERINAGLWVAMAIAASCGFPATAGTRVTTRIAPCRRRHEPLCVSRMRCSA
jgi:hypothetical protein